MVQRYNWQRLRQFNSERLAWASEKKVGYRTFWLSGIEEVPATDA